MRPTIPAAKRGVERASPPVRGGKGGEERGSGRSGPSQGLVVAASDRETRTNERSAGRVQGSRSNADAAASDCPGCIKGRSRVLAQTKPHYGKLARARGGPHWGCRAEAGIGPPVERGRARREERGDRERGEGEREKVAAEPPVRARGTSARLLCVLGPRATAHLQYPVVMFNAVERPKDSRRIRGGRGEKKKEKAGGRRASWRVRGRAGGTESASRWQLG